MKKLFFTVLVLSPVLLFAARFSEIQNYGADSLAVYKPFSLLSEAEELEQSEKRITLANNGGDILPIRELGKKNIYWLAMGEGVKETFGTYLKKYADVKELKTAGEVSGLDGYLIISYHPSGEYAGINDASHERFMKSIAGRENTIFVLFDGPLVRYPWQVYSKIQGLIIAQGNDVSENIAAAELIFGAISPQGRLSGEIEKDLNLTAAEHFEATGRLTYGFPNQVGLRDAVRPKLDSIIRRVVDSGAAPACQVLVARKGKVVYDNFYGTSMGDFTGSVPLTEDKIYDMASVTKIMACLPLIMKMYDEGVWKPDDELGDLLPKYEGTNKANLKMLDILTHTAGLQAWIPFYLSTIDENTFPSECWYRKTGDEIFTRQVTDSLFADREILEVMNARIIGSPVSGRKNYVYSDLAFIIMREFIEYHYKKPIEELIQSDFYKPLGMTRSGYRPLERFTKNDIIPSENDTYWRHTLVHGYVHDMAAAFMNGVSGHAGLFSTANDMAIMAQMYLQGGEYSGRHYIKGHTLERFTDCPKCRQRRPVQRGIGFDLYKNYDKNAGINIFGHTGFTGTSVWIDPEEEIVVVFLSNRTFLSMTNNILSREGFRTRVMEAVYDSIE